MSEIAKTYEPAAVEVKWYDFWLREGCFTADPARVCERRPAYSIVIPPPNITGVLTLGHVLNCTIQDILARRARMLGKEVLWLPGTDHAGIATQNVVERTLRKAGEMKHRDELGREALVAKIWEWKEKYGGIILQQLRALGCSCDWTRTRFTMDPEYSRCVSQVFVDLYKKGLIYRGKRMVNWCPVALTALSDEEVVMKPTNGTLYYFKVEVIEQPGAWLSIATTRPETIPGDTALAVNPKDSRYSALIGMHARRPLPLEDRAPLPIVGDATVAFDFGTGVLKVTPAHDKADFEIGQRHGLAVIDIMQPNAVMNELAGHDLAGLDRFEARKRAVELLRESGALEKEEPYQHNVGHSERADVPIEPRLSEQWFLKYPSVEQARACVEKAGKELADCTDLRDHQAKKIAPGGKSLEANLPKEKSVTQPAPDATLHVRDLLGGVNETLGEQMRFFPSRWARVYERWMANIQDWCISRQLWWGHRIPVWTSEGRSKLDRPIQVVRLTGDELAGGSIRELRASALGWAQERGLIGQEFFNLDTGNSIAVRQASLQHAFSNFGTANVKLVPGLPELLRHAVRVAILPHEPLAPEISAVEIYLGAVQIKAQLFRVKFVVKVFHGNFRLYDHQTLLLWEEKKVEPGGDKSPEEARLSAGFALRPAPDSARTLGTFAGEVNADPLFTRCQIDSPGEGWTQDPDVLDTWFSSWLWPFATMGWPEKTATLAKFYPTSDLVTGPDIIFFWVARMIMAGFEWMGDMPFRNVYFTSIIRDRQGRKLSKSLGNSADPLDLIAKYGADALRFGTMRSAPLGQDVTFDEKNVELGRNFCTKLWNAARFRQMQGGESESEIAPALLTSDDKWIVLRLDAAIREVSTALDEYRFSDAAQALYRFFWSEFCDWYLEGTKATLSSLTGARANTLAVMDFVLAHTLRLMHPFLPFVTEELWQSLGFHRDLPADQGGRTILFAHWPAPFDADFKTHYGLDESDERLAEAKHEAVNQGRALRRDFNIASNKRVRFLLRPHAPVPAYEAAVLKILLNADWLELVDASWTPLKGTPAALTPLGELFLPLEGLIDAEAERARLQKEIAKVEDELGKVRAKLANPGFAEKVPPAVLGEHRKRDTAWAEKLAQLQRMMDAL